MGAVIRIKSEIKDNKALFDIGVAGPLAGFVVCLTYLIIGFATLPDINFILEIHPENADLSSWPQHGLFFGSTLLLEGLSALFANAGGWMPPMNEIYHYPWLCTGWFGMFVTALNMLPIGQLDGGHIAYAMFGKTQHRIGSFVWRLMFFLGVGGVLGLSRNLLATPNPSELYMTLQNALNWLYSAAPWWLNMWEGWMFWAIMVRLFIGVRHPIVSKRQSLGTVRTILGWLSFIILIVSISNTVFYEVPLPNSALKIATQQYFH